MLSLQDGDTFNPMYVLGICEKKYRKHMNVKPLFSLSNVSQAPNNGGITKSIFGCYKNGKLGPLAQGLIRIDALTCCLYLLSLLRGIKPRKTQILSSFAYHSKTKKDHGTPFISSLIAIDVGISSDLIYKESRFDVFDAKRSLSQLKNIVCNADKGISSEYLAEAFKIKTSTVSAWRAHYSRGTYNFEDPPVVRVVDVGDNKGVKTSWGSAMVKMLPKERSSLLKSFLFKNACPIL